MNAALKRINLPSAFITGGLPLVEAIAQRRSVRVFSSGPVLLFQLAQVLWAAQGTSGPGGQQRTVPSAGGTYPLEVYVVIGENGMENTEAGIFHYDVGNHALDLLTLGDVRAELAAAALNQDAVAVAPVSLVICAVYDRTLMRYSARGERYVYMEVGHAGQNVYLQAVGVGLSTVAIGAFRDTEVREVLGLDEKTRPLYILPLGKPV